MLLGFISDTDLPGISHGQPSTPCAPAVKRRGPFFELGDCREIKRSTYLPLLVPEAGGARGVIGVARPLLLVSVMTTGDPICMRRCSRLRRRVTIRTDDCQTGDASAVHARHAAAGVWIVERRRAVAMYGFDIGHMPRAEEHYIARCRGGARELVTIPHQPQRSH